MRTKLCGTLVMYVPLAHAYIRMNDCYFVRIFCTSLHAQPYVFRGYGPGRLVAIVFEAADRDTYRYTYIQVHNQTACTHNTYNYIPVRKFHTNQKAVLKHNCCVIFIVVVASRIRNIYQR